MLSQNHSNFVLVGEEPMVLVEFWGAFSVLTMQIAIRVFKQIKKHTNIEIEISRMSEQEDTNFPWNTKFASKDVQDIHY